MRFPRGESCYSHSGRGCQGAGNHCCYLHATTNPMLVIRPRDDDETPDLETRLSCLIVPLDGSPVAEQILLHVEAVAVALEFPVILVRVTPAPSDYYRYMEYPIGQY